MADARHAPDRLRACRWGRWLGPASVAIDSRGANGHSLTVRESGAGSARPDLLRSVLLVAAMDHAETASTGASAAGRRGGSALRRRCALGEWLAVRAPNARRHCV